MTWKHVSDALPGWLRAEIEAMKSGASTKPAPSYQEVGRDHPSPLARPVLQVVSNSRVLAARTPRARPTLGAVSTLVLIVDNDRVAGTRGEEARAPAYQRYREGDGCC